MKYIKASTWNGKDLKGQWEFNWKIDGVRVLWDEDLQKPVSRDNKIFEGLDIGLTLTAREKLRMYGDCEFFMDDWNTSVSKARNVKEAIPNSLSCANLYPLIVADRRLHYGFFIDPDVATINGVLNPNQFENRMF